MFKRFSNSSLVDLIIKQLAEMPDSSLESAGGVSDLEQPQVTFFELGVGEADIVVRVANKKTLMPGKVHFTVRVEREDRYGGVTR